MIAIAPLATSKYEQSPTTMVRSSNNGAAASVFLGLLALFPAALGLNNGLSQKPPMGWSALYGAPFMNVNETILKAAADGLNASGLLAAGYE